MKNGRRDSLLPTLLLLFLALLSQASSFSQISRPATARVPVDELELANGMKFLLVQRPEATTVAAGWMVRAGSADDRPGHSGTSHLVEHLLFKGTRIVGSRDSRREMEILEQQDRLWSELVALRERPFPAAAKRREKRVHRLAEMKTELERLQQQSSDLAFLGQFSLFYSEQGATGLDATTTRDFTLYFVTLTPEKLELWFWLESDRLLEPVFREFFKEVQVLREERRLRIESSPSGEQDEVVRARFWGDHPYARDPQGDTRDLERLDRAAAREFFERHYGPENLTAALVGRFDVQQVAEWARSYFGRLPRGPSTPESEPEPPRQQTPGFRIDTTCDCSPRVRVLYPGVSFDHPDTAALRVLSGIMNGRTGRLYRALVLQQQIAFSAFTRQLSWRRAGEFAFFGEAKGENDPENLLAAWDEQLRHLASLPISAAELRRAKNRLTADAFRSLKDPTALMKQLLIYQGLGDWRHINRWGDRILAITAADLERVANTYLLPERRTVAIYRRPGQEAPGARDLSP